MVALLAAASLLTVHFRSADVSLPYGLHSYAQLAAELTAAGIPTICEPSLRQRYALIRLPTASWDSIRPVLEAALAVEFLEKDTGPLEMRRAPAQAALDDELLRRLNRKYSQTIQDAVHDGWEYYSRAIAEWRRGGIDATADLQDAIVSVPAGSPDWSALQVALAIRQVASHRFTFSGLWDGIDVAKLIEGTQPTIYAMDDSGSMATADNPIGGLITNPAALFQASTPDGEQTLANELVETWAFNCHTFGLTHLFVAIGDPIGVLDSPLYTEVTPDTIAFRCDWPELYKGLVGLQELRRRQDSTRRLLDSESANRELTLPPGPVTASSLFEAWSAAEGRPLVMEVLPNREALYRRSNQNAGLKVAVFLANPTSKDFVSILAQPWTFEDLDGVIVVRDEMRFADHAAMIDPAAEIALYRARHKAPDGLNTVEDFVKAANLVSQVESLTAVDANVDVRNRDLYFATPYLSIIQTSPNALKQVEGLSIGHEIRVDLDSFLPDARRRLKKQLSELARRRANSWWPALLPELDDILSGASMVVKPMLFRGEPEIRFGLVTPATKTTAFELFPVTLGPVHLRADAGD